MTTIEHSNHDRRQLEELYRQQISAVRTLARLLGYPCPIATRAEKRTTVQDVDTCGTLDEVVAVWSNGNSPGP
jgi:hypothetical protein